MILIRERPGEYNQYGEFSQGGYDISRILGTTAPGGDQYKAGKEGWRESDMRSFWIDPYVEIRAFDNRSDSRTTGDWIRVTDPLGVHITYKIYSVTRWPTHQILQGTIDAKLPKEMLPELARWELRS